MANPSPRAALPRIALLTTGGTIAGQSVAGQSAAGATPGSYRSGVLGADALIAAVPGLAALAQLRSEAIADTGSQNMTAAIWLRLARRIGELFDADAADAVVITHGTDTLEETAFFLSLVLPATRPVVLVGAMRPADALSADGPANLLAAVALAASRGAVGLGPLVVANEQIYRARGVQKISASSLHAFASPNGGAIGQVYGSQVILRIPAAASAVTPARFSVPDDARLPRVEIFYACADQDGALIDMLMAASVAAAPQPAAPQSAASQPVRGIVLAGTGAGNASQAVLAALRRAVQAGVAVVRASRTGSGYVGAGGEIDDAAQGFIAAGGLPPAKARILLMLALAANQDRAALRQHFADLG